MFPLAYKWEIDPQNHRFSTILNRCFNARPVAQNFNSSLCKAHKFYIKVSGNKGTPHMFIMIELKWPRV